MAKYSKKTVKIIVDLTKADTYTVAEICLQAGITEKTYYKWKVDHPDFAEAVEAAKDERMQMFVVEAKKSLLKLIKGYDATETRVVTVPGRKLDEHGKPIPVIKEQVTKKKPIPPDTAAIIFTLTNGDPERWRNRRSTEVTGKDGKDLFQEKTDDELTREIEDLKRKLE